MKAIPKTKALKVGQSVTKRYKIEGWIGEGGMQDVYLARDQAFDKRVALKSPKNTAAERRFLRSAKLAAQVNHPNVAATIDYVTVDESGYLIEEFIDGQDLKQLRNAVPVLDPYNAAHVAHHIVKGIAASHHAGVVHRDLKPSNIMVPAGLDLSSVKVTDFGIATMTKVELAQIDEDTITSSSTMAGALPYMSPEMLKGAKYGQKPADVWSAGAMLFELFTGDKPFGKNFDAVERIKNAQVPDLPPLCSKIQFKELSIELYGIVKKCLVKDPDARPTADDLVSLFSNVCYPLGSCIQGKVSEVRYGSQYFAHTGTEKIFFHVDSIYGTTPATGDAVCMMVYPGIPWPRAHPIVRMS